MVQECQVFFTKTALREVPRGRTTITSITGMVAKTLILPSASASEWFE